MPILEIVDNQRPANGRIFVTEPNTVVQPARDKATLKGGIIFMPSAVGSSVKGIKFQSQVQDPWIGEGLLTICADNITYEDCEIDGSNTQCQGVHYTDYYGNIPTGGSFKNIVGHSIAYSDSVGKNHVFYFRSAKNIQGENVYMYNNAGGGGYHFYSAAPMHIVQDISIKYSTFDRCFANIYAWGEGVKNITVTKMIATNIGPRGHLVIGGGVDASLIHVGDVVVTPTPGYGYVAPSSGPVVDVPAAITHLRRVLDNYTTQKIATPYTVERAKMTEVYKALVSLGGAWH